MRVRAYGSRKIERLVPATSERTATQKVVFAVYVAVVMGSILILVISIPVGLYTVFFTQLSATLTSVHPIHRLYFYIGLLPIEFPVETTIGGAFIGYYALYAAFIVLAALQARRVGSAIKEGFSSGFGALYSNPLLATFLLLGAVLFSTFLLDLFQTSVGVQVGGLKGDPLDLFLSIVAAPVAEEIGFRFALIGIPVFLIGLFLVGPSRALRALWRPSAVWDDVPGTGSSARRKTFVKLLAYSLLVVSSLLFGLAHYVSGAGWGLGKISEAAIAGLALGFAYIRYGLHTDIILHWSVNNLTAYAFFGQGVWNIPWDSDPGSSLTLGTQTFILIVLGAPSTAYIGYRLVKKLFEREPVGEFGMGGLESGGSPVVAESEGMDPPLRRSDWRRCFSRQS